MFYHPELAKRKALFKSDVSRFHLNCPSAGADLPATKSKSRSTVQSWQEDDIASVVIESPQSNPYSATTARCSPMMRAKMRAIPNRMVLKPPQRKLKIRKNPT